MQRATRRGACLAVLAAPLAVLACTPPSHQPNSVASSDDVTAYLGVVPSALVRSEHPDRVLHPAAPMGDAHIVVALYDERSGARIEDATVEATVRGERHRGAHRVRLEPMRIENTVTYGGLVSLARNDRYHIELNVTLRGEARPRRMEFLFDASSLLTAAS